MSGLINPVMTEADLDADLLTLASVSSGSMTLTLGASFVLSSDIEAIDLHPGVTLTVDGAGNTLNGDGIYRGFLVYAGDVTIDNLALASTAAIGGAGGSGLYGGGGGAGLGGGLFVAAGGKVTLSGVTMIGDLAQGGHGGGGGVSGGGAGGGGGMGGAGGSGAAIGGGGGGIGSLAVGGSKSKTAGLGIVPGVAGGGTGNSGTAGGGQGGGGSVGKANRSLGGGGGIGGGAFHNLGGGDGVGGSGGFGGGGGGGYYVGQPIPGFGGIGGFGGGGGSNNTGIGGSTGGFGGGAGGGGLTPAGPSTLGGFGGGYGGGGFPNGAGGGGGLGAGGDIFVQQGGKLVVQSGTLQGGTAIGGSAGGGGGNGGGAGSAFGGGIFLQGNETITLDPGAGQTLDVGDPIADEMGSVGASDTNQGALVIGPGTVDLAAANTYTGGTTIESGGTLKLGTATSAGGGAIVLPTSGTTLFVATGGTAITVTNTIDGLSAADSFDVLGLAAGTEGPVTVSFDGLNDQLVVTKHVGSLIRINATLQLSNSETYRAGGFHVTLDPSGTGSLVTYTACYAEGTRILTAGGERTIEALRVGDLVPDLIARRLRRVVWIGCKAIDCAAHPRPADVLPVRVRKDAFGPGMPHRDLVLSPDHALWRAGDTEAHAPGLLIPVRRLIDGRRIVQEHAATITYWHVELDAHSVLLAEGIPAESYLDLGASPFDSRAAFTDRPAAALFATARREARACGMLGRPSNG